jgi:hypothetical protein
VLDGQGLNPNEASDAQWASARAAAAKTIAAMTLATREQEMAKATHHLDDARQQMESADHATLFFKSMFGPADLVFCAIAVASAFKVATFGGRAGAE